MNNIDEILSYLKQINLLYVEDDLSAMEEVSYFLQSKVRNLYTVKNGKKALEVFNENEIDIIITDIQMPIMSGLELANEIKKTSPKIPIIITTAFNDSQYLFDAINLGISNYITKPINLKILVENLFSVSKTVILERENKEIYNTLSQYKDIVDERSIISKTDQDGIITYVNKPFLKISGYSKEEIIGKPHSIIKHSDVDNKYYSEIWHVIKDEKKLWQGEFKNCSKDGYTYYLDTIIKPILDLNGNIIEYISLSNDITYLRETKEYFKNQTEKTSLDLKESINILNQYKDAINKSNIIVRVNKNRKIEHVNDAFIEATGYSREELIGQDYSFLKQPNLTKEEYEKLVEEIFSENGRRGIIVNETKDKKLLYCDVYTYPLKDLDGNIFEYIGIRHDITEIVELHKELENTQREIIYKLGEISESRSQETGQHVKRVAEYSKLLAIKYDLSEEEINTVFTASPMHDIGKISIPDAILHKPGKLDEQEWEIMKTHSKIGYDILKNSTRPILKAAAEISHSHHEKWDGSGYPQGLKGGDIPIFGRITAIADVFDALGSDRSYKKAWPIENILDLFHKERGKHFDPNLVDIFFENIDEFLKIRDKFKD
ncbi:regulator [Malaciobacter molluscorum LMG 25693]|uniref:Regulator n=1 Tax=Malaciobacter molluscorum LMG 25693 TaxID=870501 RepID=A0A2G1DGH6_9BACT|nr:HD domain-containing phosphohydrolase [Malaciobacter molluscorum]AXX91517.1 multi-sensor domain-containing response regulator c-di-GMP phosphodiesterase, RpfG family [Malaciobacter molluscorum LMG 25693]PHO17602.1 regulator [Malaciobacter molluscorum LMG 25693]